MHVSKFLYSLFGSLFGHSCCGTVTVSHQSRSPGVPSVPRPKLNPYQTKLNLLTLLLPYFTLSLSTPTPNRIPLIYGLQLFEFKKQQTTQYLPSTPPIVRITDVSNFRHISISEQSLDNWLVRSKPFPIHTRQTHHSNIRSLPRIESFHPPKLKRREECLLKQHSLDHPITSTFSHPSSSWSA